MVSRSGGTVFSARDIGTPAAFCRKPKQLFAQPVHLIAMLEGKLLQYRVPSRRERYNHNPSVRRIVLAAHQSAAHRPADQPHYRVVPLLQKFRQFRHCGPAAAGVARYPKHQLMLLRRNARRSRRALAETQKLAKRITKIC